MEASPAMQCELCGTWFHSRGTQQNMTMCCVDCGGCDGTVHTQLDGAVAQVDRQPAYADAKEMEQAQIDAEEADGLRIALNEVGQAQISSHQLFRADFVRMLQESAVEAEQARMAAEEAEQTFLELETRSNTCGDGR